MKSFLALIFAVTFISTACGKKASYSDIKLDNKGRAITEATGQQSAETAQAEIPADPLSQASQPPAAPPQEIKMPSFFDAAKGEISDLPSYPESIRVNIQVGPIGGVDSALLILQANDPLTKVAAFYDRVAKSKGWTVVERASDPELFKLEMRKGDVQEGLVRAVKDPQSGATFITLSRIEKPVESKPPENKP